MPVPPLCLDRPYTSPEGDINDDATVDVIDLQLATNIFLGTETNATLISRADVRVCNTLFISHQTIDTILDIFLQGYG